MLAISSISLPTQGRLGRLILLIALSALIVAFSTQAGADTRLSARAAYLAGSTTTTGDSTTTTNGSRIKNRAIGTVPTETATPTTAQTLIWHAPMTREDGSSLYPGEIDGYRIYVSLNQRDRIRTIPVDDASITSLSLDSFAPGIYQFSITTIDTDGLESRRSITLKVDLT